MIKNATMLLALLVCGTAFVACGGDDDDNNGGYNGGGSSSSSRIIKITEEEGGTKFESIISYDSQGRISRIVTTETGNNNSTSEMTYQYSNEQITSKYIKESQSYTTNETHTYTLSNGLIVKDIEVQNDMKTTTIYSYNGNGYLTSLSQWGDVIASSTKDFVWTNGNLTSMDGREFKYSNTPWNKGMFFHFKGSNMDGYLWSGGYWGNTPKKIGHTIMRLPMGWLRE